ncbi:MAG: hypothetical protein Pyrs2KO_34770 [Pyruvatibacter sp.]
MRELYDRVIGCGKHLTCLSHNAGLRLAARAVRFHRQDGFFPEPEDILQDSRTPMLGDDVVLVPGLDEPFPASECPACYKRELGTEWTGRLKDIINGYGKMYYDRTGLEPPHVPKGGSRKRRAQGAPE